MCWALGDHWGLGGSRSWYLLVSQVLVGVPHEATFAGVRGSLNLESMEENYLIFLKLLLFLVYVLSIYKLTDLILERFLYTVDIHEVVG